MLSLRKSIDMKFLSYFLMEISMFLVFSKKLCILNHKILRTIALQCKNINFSVYRSIEYFKLYKRDLLSLRLQILHGFPMRMY